MKVPKGLLAAVIALVALAGGVYWSNKTKDAEEKNPKPAADAPPKILTIPADQIKGIKTASVTLNKAGDKWQITEPLALAADQDAVSSLVSSLSDLTADRLVEDKASDLGPYGLKTPKNEIAITKKDGKTATLLLGDDNPTGSGTYAKLASDPRIFTIASYVKTNLDKSPKDLRDKRLLTFNQDKLTRVTMNAIEFGKNGQNEWQILKPKPMRADGPQVDELVRKLKDAKMDTAVSEEDAKKAQTAFAGAAKVGTATTSDNSGTQTLEVRKDKEKNYYAKSSAVEGVYKITNDLGDAMAKAPDDFRNKKLFDFGFAEPSKVEVGTTTFQKSGEKWMSGSTQMDAPGVQGVVDKLRDLAATKFPEKGGGDSYLTLTVASDKRVEKVAVTKQGDNYFAVREGEPGIYQTDGKAIDELQKAAAAVKPYTPPKDEKKKK